MSMRRILGTTSSPIGLRPALPGSVAAAPTSRAWRSSSGRPSGLTDLYRSVGAAAAREARRWTNDVVMVVSPERDLAGRQARAPRRVDRRLPRPRQRLSLALSQLALPTHPERSRAQPGGRRWRQQPSVLRRIVHRPGDPAGARCGRPAQPPVLCERQLRAGPARGLAWVGRNGSTTTRRAGSRPAPGRSSPTRSASPGRTSGRSSAATDDRRGLWRDAPTFHDHVLTFASLGRPGQRPRWTRPGRLGLQPLDRLAPGADRRATCAPGPAAWPPARRLDRYDRPRRWHRSPPSGSPSGRRASCRPARPPRTRRRVRGSP